MKKEIKNKILETIKNFFMIKNPIRNILFFIIMAFFSAFIKFGILIWEEMINGITFNFFIYIFVMGISIIIISITYLKLKGYFILSGTLMLLWIVLETKINLVSMSTTLLAIGINIQILIFILGIFIKTLKIMELKKKFHKKNCKKKKDDKKIKKHKDWKFSFLSLQLERNRFQILGEQKSIKSLIYILFSIILIIVLALQLYTEPETPFYQEIWFYIIAGGYFLAGIISEFSSINDYFKGRKINNEMGELIKKNKKNKNEKRNK